MPSSLRSSMGGPYLAPGSRGRLAGAGPTIGRIAVDRMPAPTSAAAVAERMCPSSTAIVVIATTSGSSVAENTARAAGRAGPGRLCRGAARALRARPGTGRGRAAARAGGAGSSVRAAQVELDAADDEEEGDEEAVADRGELRLEHLDLASLERDTGDHPGDEAAQQQVQAERGRQRAECEDGDHRDPDRQLATGLERSLEQLPAAANSADGDHSRDHGDGDEDEQDHRVLGGALGGEDEGDQQDRAELAHRSGREQVGTEARPQLARVAQDRDQGADRGGRHCGPGEQQGQHQAGQLRAARPTRRRGRARAPNRARRAGAGCRGCVRSRSRSPRRRTACRGRGSRRRRGSRRTRRARAARGRRGSRRRSRGRQPAT